MAFLLADAAKLTRNMLLKGIIQTLITESRMLNYLPFLDVVGSGLDFNQEATLPNAEWHAVNDAWNTPSEPTLTKKHAALAILGGDADVDNFIRQVYSNEQDIQALVTQEKAKAVAYAFNNAFFYGDDQSDPNQFNGLVTQAGGPVLGYANVDPTHRAFVAAADGKLLDLATMDQLVDAVKPGKPDALFMSKRSRRKLSSLRRASGNLLEVGVDAFGQRALYYDGIPLEVDENIPDTFVQGASGNVCSDIVAVQFGAGSRVGGIQHGGIQTVLKPDLETKDGSRVRIKWYVNGAVIFNTLSYAILRGVKDS